MRPALLHTIFIVAIAWFCSPVSFVRAMDLAKPITIQSAKVGIDGRFKSGFWTPIRIELRNGAAAFKGDIEIVVPDSDGVATRFQWQDLGPIELDANESRTVTRLVKMGRSNLPIQIELRTSDTLAIQHTVSVAELASPIPAAREWVIVLGSDINVSDALGRNSRTGMNTVESYLPEAELFPDQWLGLEAVDTVILTTSDKKKLDAISSQQLTALREWVVMGGRLIISVGQNGKELISANGRLSDLVPGRFVEVAALKNLASLESYSASTQRIEFASKSDPVIPVTVLANVRGIVELSDTVADETRPMVVRSSMGFGQTTFVGFDLELPSIADWEGRPRILARVLQATEQMDRQRRGDSNTQVAQFGYQDLVGQLRSALDQFPAVQLVALWWVAALVTIYVVLIGPVDYFLLRDVFRRMTLTWITFPLVTLIFVGLVFYLGPRWKGSEVLVNQIDLVDVDVVSSRFRTTTWAHVYSPRSATYEMQCAPNAKLASAVSLHGNVLSWQGLPGTGLGGLETAAAAPPSINEYRLEFTNSADSPSNDQVPTLHASLHGVPIQVAATKSVLGRSWGEIQLDGEANLTMDLDGLPRGEVSNPLPVELQDCVVYFGNWAFRLEATRGVLAPGQKTRIELERALNLRWRLTGRRVIDTKDVGTPWDQHTLEVPRIMEMMMFHEAAGGDSYTQLISRYQASIDLSQQLLLQRAILIGRAPNPATNLKLNDTVVAADQQWTYFRIVYPLSNPR